MSVEIHAFSTYTEGTEMLPKDYGLKVPVRVYDYLNKKLSYINIFD